MTTINLELTDREMNRIIKVLLDVGGGNKKTELEKKYQVNQTAENRKAYLNALDDLLLIKKLRKSKPKRQRSKKEA